MKHRIPKAKKRRDNMSRAMQGLGLNGKPTVIWKDVTPQDSSSWLEIKDVPTRTCTGCHISLSEDAFRRGSHRSIHERCNFCQARLMSAARHAPTVAPLKSLTQKEKATAKADAIQMCKGCGRTFLLDAANFFRDAGKPTGYRTNCKDCTMGRPVRTPIDVSTEVWEPVETRCCSRCDKRYPRTAEYFHRDSSKADGLRYYCKGCVHEARGKRRHAAPTSSSPTPVALSPTPPEKRVSMRLCEWCNTRKPLDKENFYSKNKRGQFDIRCRDCRLQRQHDLESGLATRKTYRGPYAHLKPSLQQTATHTPFLVRLWRWLTKGA